MIEQYRTGNINTGSDPERIIKVRQATQEEIAAFRALAERADTDRYDGVAFLNGLPGGIVQFPMTDLAYVRCQFRKKELGILRVFDREWWSFFRRR